MNGKPRTLSQIVRTARESAGLTQDELAEKIGKSQRWVSAIEAGEIKFPRKATLERMVFPLKVSFAELLIAAGYAASNAEAARLASSPDRKERTLGSRLDAVYDRLSAGERASVEAIVRTAERSKRQAK